MSNVVFVFSYLIQHGEDVLQVLNSSKLLNKSLIIQKIKTNKAKMKLVLVHKKNNQASEQVY